MKKIVSLKNNAFQVRVQIRKSLQIDSFKQIVGKKIEFAHIFLDMPRYFFLNNIFKCCGKNRIKIPSFKACIGTQVEFFFQSDFTYGAKRGEVCRYFGDVQH